MDPMNGGDNVFSFPYLRNNWYVGVSRPSLPGELARWQATTVRVSADTEELAKAAAVEHMGAEWSANSCLNCEESAIRNLADTVALLWRDD